MKKSLYGLTFFLSWLVITPGASAMTCEFTIEKALQYGSGPLSVDRDVTSGPTTEQKLYLDAYLPTVCDGKPVTGDLAPVIWIHGGGFSQGARDGEGMVKLGSELARNGFATFSIDYRLVPTPNQKNKATPILETLSLEEQKLAREKVADGQMITDPLEIQNINGAFIAVEDTLKAEEWISENQSRFKINPERFGYIGGSAGAGTVLALGYIADNLGFASSNAAALVSIAGRTQPLSFMEAGEPPLFIVHGTADTVVPYVESDKLLARAAEVGIPAERITMKGIGHGHSNITERTIDGTDEPIISRVIPFFARNLRCDPSTDANCLVVASGSASPLIDDSKVPVRPSLWDRIWNFISGLFS